MNGSVFISYRRGDATGYAGRLYDRLRARLPRGVFMDVSEIAPGADFDVTISNALASCVVLIAMIGRDWAGTARLADPADYVRREINAALRRNVRVVPVLIHGANMPSESELPDDLKPLTHRQALEMSDTSWDASYEQLLGVIEKELGVEFHPKRQRQMWVAVGIGALVITAILIVPATVQRLRYSGPSRSDGATSGQQSAGKTPVPVSGKDADAAGATQKSAVKEYVQQEVRALDNATSVMSGIADQIGNAGSQTETEDAFFAATWEIKRRGEDSDSVLVLKQDHTLEGRWAHGAASGTWSYDHSNLLRLQFRSPSVTQVLLQVPHIEARDARGAILKPRMFRAIDSGGSTINFVRKGN
jgi:hypothetical protein